jgi:cyanophycin synthetase
VGVPVPEGAIASSPEEAWEAAQEIGVPVVVKPQYGNQGRGVAVNLTTREQVEAAWKAAREEGRSILVEKFAPGDDYRLLVIGGRVVAASHRRPPSVTGDGVRTVRQLVDDVNLDPRRGEDHATSLSKLRLDAIGLGVLAEQGFDAESLIPAGLTVVLRRNANLSTGGSAADVTDLVHPEVAARAVEAARVIGLDIAGIDVVCRDISRPLEEQHGIVVEVNAAPGLRMHLEPSEGKARPVGEAIVGTMFDGDQNGRIPLVAVTGNNGKTTTARLTAHLFKAAGLTPGLTCSDGVYVDGRRIDTGDCSGPKSARSVLMNPLVEAAVLETARGGLLREGLGFDRADVAIVTNLGEGDHLGLNGIDTIEQLARVKATLVENVAPSGCAVLNAADPHTLAMVPKCPGAVVLFGREATQPVVAAHVERGGRAVVAEQGAVVLVEGHRREMLVALADVPLTRGGRIAFQVENVLAAVAAAWSVGLSHDAIRSGLATFSGDSAQVPGRFNVRHFGGATVVMDYGHNADALLALVGSLAAMPHQHRTVIISAAGDRRDADIVRQGEICGNGFDHVVLYEDACNRGRVDGEVTSLLRRGVDQGRRVQDVIEVRGEHVAIEGCLRRLRGGDLLLVLVDQVEESIRFVDATLSAEAARRETAAKSAPDPRAEQRARALAG